MNRLTALSVFALVACGGEPAYLTEPAADCSSLTTSNASRDFAIWNEVPEYAGATADSHSVITIRMTTVTGTERFWKWFPTDARYETAAVNWGQLVRAECQVSKAMADPDIVSIAPDAASNTTLITVTNGAALERVTRYADAHASPRELVTTALGSRPVPADSASAD